MSTSLFDLTDKHILLIGATGILGRQYVRYLRQQGVRLHIADISLEQCEALIEEDGHDLPGSCNAYHVDLLEEGSLEELYKRVLEKAGRLHAVVNNSQVKPKGFYDSFERFSRSSMRATLEGNTIGFAESCRLACSHFLENDGGVIVNVASIYGIVAADQRIYDGVTNPYSETEPFSSPVGYAVSKAGVVQLTRYLASYYRSSGIRVNTLTPGGVYDDHDDTFNSAYSARTLMGRMADRTEYNGAMHFLLSQASSYMTGANLVVDGGWTAT
jgi:2-deoxy-D-gluconate 3-dehydrogenase